MLELKLEVCLTLENNAKLLSKVVLPFYTPTGSVQSSSCPLPYQNLRWPLFLMIDILTCYLILVLIFVSLMTNDVEHFSCAYLPSSLVKGLFT